MSDLWTIAKNSLEQNTVSSNEGDITVAGANHFKTFWVRDFCYAVPGLLKIGRDEQVKKQILICLKYLTPDGLIARGFDVINPKLRVVSGTFGLQKFNQGDYKQKNLKAEYLGEHNTPSVDSNLLVLLAILQWTEHCQNNYFFTEHKANLEKVFTYILSLKEGDFLSQPPYSDWQDSARREGPTFYLNLLFCRVLEKLQNNNIPWSKKENLDQFKKNLWSRFYEPKNGLFLSQLNRLQFSLETQLWCIEENIFKNFISRSQLWANLITSPLWLPLPGRPVYPDYPSKDVSWTTKVVGLRHYHDQFYWSWLMGESLKVAQLMDSEPQTKKLTDALTKLAKDHHTIHEIYEMKETLAPVIRPLYTSEHPFSWGAAKILEALSLNKSNEQ